MSETIEPVAWSFNRPGHQYKFFTTDPEADNLKRSSLIPLYSQEAVDALVKERDNALESAWFATEAFKEANAKPAVAVKPLKWDEPSGHGVDPYYWAIGAKTSTKGYRIDWEGYGLGHTNHKGPFKLMDVGSFPTIEKAKAAAQADYEQRIKSALE